MSLFDRLSRRLGFRFCPLHAWVWMPFCGNDLRCPLCQPYGRETITRVEGRRS
jgi:hypothetical protein